MKNQTVADQITRARTALVLDQPFIGVLALRLKIVEDETIPTAAVDGKCIRYNPTFIAKLTPGETMTLIGHEVFHCVFDHVGRRGDRDPRRHNQAGDYIINETLDKAGFAPIKGWLRDPKYDGMSSDEVYNLLPEDNDPGKDPLDDCRDGDPTDCEMNASEWKVATIQAANAARAMGKLPASMARFVDALTASKVDWRAILRRFVVETSKNDYSWMRPNRRFMAQGLMLPTIYSESMGEIVVAIDTSGSIDQDTLNAFGSEIKAIVQSVRPSKTYTIYCDADVNHVDEFGPNDELHFEMHGGGGTNFAPPFTYVDEHGIKPVCLVYLTDLYGDLSFAPPDYPVLWCCTTDVVAPFGETVKLEL